MRVTRLVCGNCGLALSGLRSDQVFFCSNCGRGWSIGNDGLKPVEVQCRAGADSPLPVPFWQVRATVHVLKRTVRNDFTSTGITFGSRYESDLLKGRSTETGSPAEKRTFLFPAFPVDGLPGIGASLSRHISALPDIQGIEEKLPDICGASIASYDASVLARCVAVAQEAEKPDWLAEIDIILSSVKSVLVILPCVQEVEKVNVAGTGVFFFRRAVLNWEEIADYHNCKP
jgi:hypothetical protein